MNYNENIFRIASSCDSFESLSRCLFGDAFQEEGWNDKEEIADPVVHQEPQRSISDAGNAKKYPNILKRKENIPKPIENLAFSPSRFLSDPRGPSATPSSTSHELNMSCSSPGKESIIENNGNDLDGMFALPSLTSTPICNKFYKKLSTPDKHDTSPLKPAVSLHDSCISMTLQSSVDYSKYDSAIYSGSETGFKTPNIRKFLNQTGPRTPTPFKCESNLEEKDITLFESSLLLKNDPQLGSDHFLTSSCDLNAPIVRENHMSPPHSTFSKMRSRKRARKALLLDQDWPLALVEGKKCEMKLKEDAMPLATRLPESSKREDLGFVSLESTPSNSKMRVRRVSGLVDDKTVVKRKKFCVGRKSFFYTSHSEHSERSFHEMEKDKTTLILNRQWVSVACGCSDDQREMTNAARKYFKQNHTSGSILSQLPRGFSSNSNIR